MIFALENILNSLAAVLKEKYPQHPVYFSPNQQGTDFPCFFIFFMPSTIEGQPSRRFIRDLGIDIVFVQQRNMVNGNAEVLAIAEYLDEVLELFPYSDKWNEDGSGEIAENSRESKEGEAAEPDEGVWIRTFERQWKSEDEELHYQFHIKQRVTLPEVNVLMKMMEGNFYVKEK